MDNIYNPLSFEGERSTSISNMTDNISNYYASNNYRNKVDKLYNSLSDIKPLDSVPERLNQKDYLEQDIELDIDKNKFKQIWTDYRLIYNEKAQTKNTINNNQYENKFLGNKSYVMDNFDQIFDNFLIKAKDFNKYIDDLKKEQQELRDNNELIELSKKEIEQEKELLNVEKQSFEDYKKEEQEKLNNNLIRFQNIVEEINSKIEDILN